MTPTDPRLTPGQALVARVRTVPEARLRIVQLAWELAAPDGTLDEAKAIPRMGEIRDACQQAEDYGEGTKKLAGNLKACLRDPW